MSVQLVGARLILLTFLIIVDSAGQRRIEPGASTQDADTNGACQVRRCASCCATGRTPCYQSVAQRDEQDGRHEIAERRALICEQGERCDAEPSVAEASDPHPCHSFVELHRQAVQLCGSGRGEAAHAAEADQARPHDDAADEDEEVSDLPDACHH
eukprot:CAMPEP_0118817118 /NCGR_PEP_ID=MMETSP1162-20130426/5205_1 /TAXON_ID=33656 /ORGANISM="Phaeocystis Sp, Strain CCMP2710" /LENGTH=155 /DNA_ID=CAMNT_0006747191 /DNA_START=149 /DNA_END=614 /DNA_ORIENTATION=+